MPSNRAATLADLAATSVVPNARVLMADLNGAGVKLTAKGNLNRKLVESLAGRFQWEGYPSERVWSVNKVLNEGDYSPASYLHGVLKLAGLARTEKGFIKLTGCCRSRFERAAANFVHTENLDAATFLYVQ